MEQLGIKVIHNHILYKKNACFLLMFFAHIFIVMWMPDNYSESPRMHAVLHIFVVAIQPLYI